MTRKVQYLLLDLGGVLLNIAPQLTSDAFQKLGLVDMTGDFASAKQSELFDGLETGSITPDQFLHALSSRTSQPVSLQEVEAAWNALLLDFPDSRIQLLRKLKAQMPIFLLSNTNEIHLAHIDEKLATEQGVSGLSDFFHAAYYSCRVGLRKPDPLIFEAFLKAEGVPAEDTLFVDDTAPNIAIADELGFQTILFRQGDDLGAALADFEILIAS